MCCQFAVEAMVAEGLNIAYDDKFHACPCDGHIHAAQVAKEADVSVSVATHKADEYHVAFLPLKAVDGADTDLSAEAAEVVLHLQQSAYEARLPSIGGDDSKIDTLVFNALR